MKEKLLRLIAAARAHETELLVPHVDDREPERQGMWTAKDQLAHMMSWRQVAVGEIDSVRTGSPAPEVSTDDDVENAKFYSQTHHQAAKAIIESAASSWDSLAAGVQACTEEQLQAPRPRRPDLPLWFGVSSNTHEHEAEHLAYWYQDQGDEGAAEAAAIWGHDLAIEVFQDDRRRGVADYNLACFYARRGDVTKALPWLTRGLGLRPDLRDYARQDKDLDSIRSNAEVAALLG